MARQNSTPNFCKHWPTHMQTVAPVTPRQETGVATLQHYILKFGTRKYMSLTNYCCHAFFRTLYFSVMDQTSERNTTYNVSETTSHTFFIWPCFVLLNIYVKSQTILNFHFSQQFYVEPINDAPTLYFSALSNHLKELVYSEDDPHLPLADDVILQDVDTDIVLVVVELSGLINKEHDVFSFNETLANGYGVNITQTVSPNGMTGTITLNGPASAEYYEQVRLQFMIN